MKQVQVKARAKIGQPFRRHKKKPLAKEGQRLTEMENAVAGLLAQGLTNKEIASQAGISEHTVKFHVNNAMRKLGATTRTKAAVDFITKIRPAINPVASVSDAQDQGEGAEECQDRKKIAIMRDLANELLADLHDRPPSGGAAESARLVGEVMSLLDALDAARVE